MMWQGDSGVGGAVWVAVRTFHPSSAVLHGNKYLDNHIFGGDKEISAAGTGHLGSEHCAALGGPPRQQGAALQHSFPLRPA